MSDPSTLLQATVCVCGVSALAIWCGVRVLGFNREAGRDWAWANALFGLGSLLTVIRGQWQEPVLYALADAFELIGFACLHTGLMRFLGRAWPRGEHVGVLGVSIAGVLLAYLAGAPVWRLAVYCAAAAWLLARAAGTAYAGLRGEFGARASAVVAGPIAVASALQAVRGVQGVLGEGAAVVDSLQPTGFNLVLMWAALSISLMLNFAVAGFAGARQMAHIRELTLRDALTGALNRRALEQLLQRELANWRRREVPLALVYLDLDHFKGLNDRFGHAAGDQALRHVAKVLCGTCREGDALARVGGEEFCALLPHTTLEGACLMAERMRAQLEASPFGWEQQSIRLTASFGVAAVTGQDDCASEILRRADEAMYEAKRNGRNCVVATPTKTATQAVVLSA